MKNHELQSRESGENTQTVSTAGDQPPALYSAFEFLRSLPPYQHRFCKDGYTEKTPSKVIDADVAQKYTDTFRAIGTSSFTVPISWSFDKAALVNLLGITSYSDYPAVNGIRFYAGINEAGQLTLIAVSTTASSNPDCTDCNDDLTVDDKYPYYDYADPCPNNCSSTGNLQGSSTTTIMMKVLGTE